MAPEPALLHGQSPPQLNGAEPEAQPWAEVIVGAERARSAVAAQKQSGRRIMVYGASWDGRSWTVLRIHST